jgi:hypothetical protein
VGRQGEKGVKEVVETEVRMVEKGVSTAAAARVEMREGARVAVVREAAVEEWAEVEAEVGLPGVMGVVATWEAMRVVEVMVEVATAVEVMVGVEKVGAKVEGRVAPSALAMAVAKEVAGTAGSMAEATEGVRGVEEMGVEWEAGARGVATAGASEVAVMVGAKAVGLAEGTAAVMVAERWVERDRTC